MIKDNIIDSIKNLTKIEEVIGDFISLKKKGNNLWANCPFHNEKTPSFSVSPNKGFYKCFGCDAKGDAINFLRELEGMTYIDAIRYLGKKYGVEIEEDSNESDNIQKNEKEFLYIIYDLAKEYYKNNLWNTDQGRDICNTYLENRGIKKKYAENFDLGFSLKSWDEFLKFAITKGYTEENLEKSGLIIKKDDKLKKNLYDRFRTRLIFPIHNVYGKVVAFGGRKLSDAIEGPKYINSPETPIFHKSNILYGIYQAKKTIKEEDNCYLVEGYTDVISLHMIGIKNVVASGGTSLTENQINLLSRFTKNITIIFDGDEAGLSASMRGIDIILEQGLNVKIIILPKDEDPDSFARKKGSKEFIEFLKNNNKDFITFKANILTKEFRDDPIKRAEAINNIMTSILSIPDAIKRSIFIRECSKILEINEDVLVSEHNRISNINNIHIKNLENNKLKLPNYNLKPKIEDTIKILEKEIVSMLLKYGEEKISSELFLKEYILKEIEEIEFTDLNCKFIIEEFRNNFSVNNINVNYFLSKENEELKDYIIDIIAIKNEMSLNWEEKLGQYILKESDNLEMSAFRNILKLKLNTLRKLVLDNQKSITNELNQDELKEKLSVHSYLKDKEKEIAKKLGMVTFDIHNT